MANYQQYKYTDDDGDTHPIRLSDKVAAAQPTAASAGPPYTSQISADVGRSSREIGLKPREVLLRRSTGTGDARKVFSNKMPVLVSDDVDTLLAAGTVTIGGVAWQVVNSDGESMR